MKNKKSPTISRSFAYYGPTSKHFIPQGGFCISAFALIQNEKGETLLITPRNVRKWAEEWSPNVRLMNPERLEKFKKGWLFPASYVREGENPNDTLYRVMLEQLGVSSYQILRQKLHNFYDPSYMFPEKMHWDYCFVYKVRIARQRVRKPWFSVAKFINVSTLAKKDFSSAQGDLALALGLL